MQINEEYLIKLAEDNGLQLDIDFDSEDDGEMRTYVITTISRNDEILFTDCDSYMMDLDELHFLLKTVIREQKLKKLLSLKNEL